MLSGTGGRRRARYSFLVLHSFVLFEDDYRPATGPRSRVLTYLNQAQERPALGCYRPLGRMARRVADLQVRLGRRSGSMICSACGMRWCPKYGIKAANVAEVAPLAAMVKAYRSAADPHDVVAYGVMQAGGSKPALKMRNQENRAGASLELRGARYMCGLPGYL